MNRFEIIETIRSHKKYSDSNFEFDGDHIYYKIGNNKYRIEVNDNWKKVSFYHPLYKFNLKDINITLVKGKNDSKRIITKFREVVKSINKLDLVIQKRKEILSKIIPVIKIYIKSEFLIDADFEDKANMFKFNYPKTVSKPKRGRYRTTIFDITKETIESINKIKYYIFTSVKDKDSGIYYSLSFEFDSDVNKLTLIKREENYRSISKDITKIIRSEKLKRIMFINDEETI